MSDTPEPTRTLTLFPITNSSMASAVTKVRARIDGGGPGRDRENDGRAGNQARPESDPRAEQQPAEMEGDQGRAHAHHRRKERAPNSLTPNSSKPPIIVQNISGGFSGNIWPLNQGHDPVAALEHLPAHGGVKRPRPCPTARSGRGWQEDHARRRHDRQLVCRDPELGAGSPILPVLVAEVHGFSRGVSSACAQAALTGFVGTSMHTVDDPPPSQHHFSRMSALRPYCRGLLLPAVFLLAAAAALLVDLPVATAFQQLKHDACHAASTARTWLAYLGYLDMFELFGHGLGVVLVVLMLHQLDPGRRWAIPRVLACAWRPGWRPTC